jgi:hypothetical protein
VAPTKPAFSKAAGVHCRRVVSGPARLPGFFFALLMQATSFTYDDRLSFARQWLVPSQQGQSKIYDTETKALINEQ